MAWARVAAAIEKQEGFRPGTRAWENFNPGNLKMGKRARRFGAVSMDDQHHAIFPSVEQGRAALRNLIETKGAGLTLRQIGKWYAEHEGWAAGVSKLSGIGLDEVVIEMAEPKWLQLARKEIGAKEWPGARHNPAVMNYFLDATGFQRPDEVPWCAAFVGAMLRRAGYEPSGSTMARSYLKWGSKMTKPEVGAVVVFPRGSSKIFGHVGFVVSFDRNTVWVLGGNQRDAVNIKPYNRSSVLGFRWPAQKPTQTPTAPRIVKAVP